MGSLLIRHFALCCLLGMSAVAQSHRNIKVGLRDYNDADVKIFAEGSVQPSGHAVLLLSSWRHPNFADHWFQSIATKYDLGQLDAVLIDQPYWSELGTPDGSNPCSDSRENRIGSIRTQ